uniref:phosphotransferase n=1 Tax=Falsiroseomonas oryziterrae TaxID=2911368 RepID=UPI001F225BE3
VIARRACRRAGLAAQVATCLGAADPPPLLVQQRLAGRSLQLRQRGRILPEAELRAHVAAAMAPLMRLHAQARRVPDGPDHALIFRDLPVCLDRHPALAAPLGPALRALQRWPARSDLGAVLVHGDYWLGNLLFDAEGAVCGIVDWERCRQDGCAGLDALHLAAASYGVWRARPLALVFEEIWTRRWSSPFLQEHVAAVTAAIALSEKDVTRLAVLLWLGYVRSSVLAMDPPADDWLQLNVAQPARSLPAWMG